jgi:hypothetical protein
MDLAEFLSARVAEEEALAQAAIDAQADAPLAVEYDANWNPWRVLAGCVAKRLILAAHRRVEVAGAEGHGVTHACSMCRPDQNRSGWPCYTVRTLALEYADHVDYRYEWRPQRLRVLR